MEVDWSPMESLTGSTVTTYEWAHTYAYIIITQSLRTKVEKFIRTDVVSLYSINITIGVREMVICEIW